MFEPLFMRLALLASIATGVSLGVLGVYLVLRRVVFLGLVVANAATLGAALAATVGWAQELPSLAAAAGTAVALSRVESSGRNAGDMTTMWIVVGGLEAPMASIGTTSRQSGIR